MHIFNGWSTWVRLGFFPEQHFEKKKHLPTFQHLSSNANLQCFGENTRITEDLNFFPLSKKLTVCTSRAESFQQKRVECQTKTYRLCMRFDYYKFAHQNQLF